MNSTHKSTPATLQSKFSVEVEILSNDILNTSDVDLLLEALDTYRHSQLKDLEGEIGMIATHPEVYFSQGQFNAERLALMQASLTRIKRLNYYAWQLQSGIDKAYQGAMGVK